MECEGSTYEIVTCQKGNLAVLEKRLTGAYAKALEMADSDKQRAQLRLSQELWIKFRDANCDYYELGEGTISRIRGGICMLDLTRARARNSKRRWSRSRYLFRFFHQPLRHLAGGSLGPAAAGAQIGFAHQRDRNGVRSAA